MHFSSSNTIRFSAIETLYSFPAIKNLLKHNFLNNSLFTLRALEIKLILSIKNSRKNSIKAIDFLDSIFFFRLDYRTIYKRK